MRIVKVDSDYIKELKKYDDKVYDNKGGRPYIGFLIDIDDHLFVAPLTSPKEKHKNWSNKKKDIYLIENGSKGVLQLSSMIPVQDYFCEDYDLNDGSKYSELLKSQFIDIDNNKEHIKKKAERLLMLNRNKPNHYELKNCCDYKLLKKACHQYIKIESQKTIRHKM